MDLAASRDGTTSDTSASSPSSSSSADEGVLTDGPTGAPTEAPTDESTEAATDGPADGPTDEPAFGGHPAGRFGADVEYRGRAGEHDYVVQVRHRLLDTAFTLVIDDVEHDPAAEEKAEKAAKKAAPKAARTPGEEPTSGEEQAAEEEQSGEGEPASPADGIRFHVEEGFTTLRCTVRRVREGGEVKDCEVLTIRTAGLGGAGEVEVRHGFRTTVLVPAEGSPSAARDARRTAHPTRYALVAALTKSAKYLLPLLGLGALLSGLLDPLAEWIEARIRPAVEAIAQATAPVRDWIADLLRPVVELLDALLQPLRDLLSWLGGLLPDLSLPFGVPEWLIDVIPPVLVVLAAFLATRSALQRRREQLEESAQPDDDADGPGKGSEDDAKPRDEDGPDSPEEHGEDDPDSAGEGSPAEDRPGQANDRPAGEARNVSRSARESSTQN